MKIFVIIASGLMMIKKKTKKMVAKKRESKFRKKNDRKNFIKSDFKNESHEDSIKYKDTLHSSNIDSIFGNEDKEPYIENIPEESI